MGFPEFPCESFVCPSVSCHKLDDLHESDYSSEMLDLDQNSIWRARFLAAMHARLPDWGMPDEIGTRVRSGFKTGRAAWRRNSRTSEPGGSRNGKESTRPEQHGSLVRVALGQIA